VRDTILSSAHKRTGISTCLRALAKGSFFSLRAREKTETAFDVFSFLIDLLAVLAFALSLYVFVLYCLDYFFRGKTLEQ